MSDFITGSSKRERMLVSTTWLHEHLGDDDLSIIDCSARLVFQPVGPSRVESGWPAFLESHIPGAGYLNMAVDLSDPQGPYAFAMPGVAQVEAVLGKLGISPGNRIILYGHGYVGSVTRVWYVLHAAGHRNLALLDGGFEQWQAEGRPVSAGVPTPVPQTYQAALRDGLRSERRDVEAAIHSSGTGLINALSREQFLGHSGTHYGRPGRIPSSVSVPARDLLEADGRRFRSDAELRQIMLSNGVRPEQRLISYCGGGIAATITSFVLEMLGHEHWSVYDDSLNEWATCPALPMVIGE